MIRTSALGACVGAWVAACTEEPIAPAGWQLDQDRIVAVRVTPPGVSPGEHALVDGLLAHAGGPTTIELPSAISAPHSPLFSAVNFLFDHYEIIGPDEPALAAARSELGLPAGAPVPVELDTYFGPLAGDHVTAHKQMWMGASEQNPALPALTIDHAPAPASGPVIVERGRDLALAAAAGAGANVSWLSSCGVVADGEQPAATLRIDAACTGELAVVVRDARGGTVWQVWPISAE